jgi:hypothetical protein
VESGSFSQQRREEGLRDRAASAVQAAEAVLNARQALDDVDESQGKISQRAAFRRTTALLGEAEGNYVSARLELALERCCAALEASLDPRRRPWKFKIGESWRSSRYSTRSWSL